MTLPLSHLGVSVQRRCRYSTRNAWYENGDVLVAFCAAYLNAVYLKVSSTIVPVGELTVRVWDTKKGVQSSNDPLTPVGGEDILFVESNPVSPGDLFQWEPPLSEQVYEHYSVGGRDMAKQTSLGLLFEQGIRVQLWDSGTNLAVDDSTRLTAIYYI